MKKKLITFIAILNLIFFSSISSAQAFIDPASLTLIFGAAFVTVVTGSELIRDSQAEPAQAQIQKEDPVKGQAREKTDKITETQIGTDPSPSGS
ncbi:hypothetical protein [Desulfospira joergensenii]|uniref:hypothetical protein n=1 Tax=Desulfospira joergensenii TaxID=53329 RepID=UPI0003B41A65|nr:hypothetical protein [Desulfospira joergensenii]